MKIRKTIILLFSVLWLSLLAAAPLTAADGTFTIAVIPDTQNHLSGLGTLVDWIVSEKTARRIAFVAHVGDVVNTCTNSTDYNTADAALDKLDNGGVPYGVSPGNHDQTGSGTCMGTSLYPQPQYFGTPRFSGKPYYGGSYDDWNNYFLFSAGGMDFIIIFLKYFSQGSSPDTGQLAWADTLLKAYPSHRGIVVSHAIISYDNNWVYQSLYTSLRGNPNLFLMLCGHMHTSNDGEGLRSETYNGNTVHIIMSDYQDIGSKLRIITFDPSLDLIYVKRFDPPSTVVDQFTLSYKMSALYGDFAFDCDVDGTDLSALIANLSLADLMGFAGNFGESICP